MARAYADMSRDELSARLEISEGLLRRIESNRRKLTPLETPGYVERLAAICELPAGFFTADLAQLEPGFRPPEDQLESLERTVRALMDQLTDLAAQADFQLKDGNEKLEQFGAIIADADIAGMGHRLQRIEKALKGYGAQP